MAYPQGRGGVLILGTETHVLTTWPRIWVAVSRIDSRLPVALGSRDLTTASIKRGRLGYKTRGFYQTPDENKQGELWIGLAFLIKKANNCMTALRCSGLFGFKISKERVVINNGVLEVAICKTATLAWEAGFRITGIFGSRFVEVAKSKRVLKISIVSR
jgi:hypothetical protein